MIAQHLFLYFGNIILNIFHTTIVIDSVCETFFAKPMHSAEIQMETPLWLKNNDGSLVSS